MSSSGLLFHSSTLVLFILISHYSAKSEDAGNNYGDGSSIVPSPSACNNCTICQYPCHPQPPPPPSGDQSYAAPPPPSVGQVNCPPATPVVCCGGQYYAPPTPFYYPYNNYSGAAAVTLQLSALIRPGSFASTWLLTISLYYVLLLICY